MYVLLASAWTVERTLFMFSTQEFIYSKPVLDESKNFSFKNRGPSSGP
jgi:hypothetical protein